MPADVCPINPADKIPQEGRNAAVLALGRLGAGRSLSVLESLQADDDPFVRAAVAEALLTAPPPAAIPILQEMAAESRPAAWALIRLGDKAESAIIEILTEPTFRSAGPAHLIREYYEHWKELPAPPTPRSSRPFATGSRPMPRTGRVTSTGSMF